MNFLKWWEKIPLSKLAVVSEVECCPPVVFLIQRLLFPHTRISRLLAWVLAAFSCSSQSWLINNVLFCTLLSFFAHPPSLPLSLLLLANSTHLTPTSNNILPDSPCATSLPALAFYGLVRATKRWSGPLPLNPVWRGSWPADKYKKKKEKNIREDVDTGLDMLIFPSSFSNAYM